MSKGRKILRRLVGVLPSKVVKGVVLAALSVDLKGAFSRPLVLCALLLLQSLRLVF